MHVVLIFAYNVRLSFNLIFLRAGLSVGASALFIEKCPVSYLDTVVKKRNAFKYEW